MRGPWVGLAVAGALLLLAPAWPSSAAAADRWSDPLRSVRYLRRTTHMHDGEPLSMHAAVVDLCDPAVELRATAPGERGRTVPGWAARVHASVAINGDYFENHDYQPLGPARGNGQWWPRQRRIEHRDTLLGMHAGEPLTMIDGPLDEHEHFWGDVRRVVGTRWSDVVAARERILLHGEQRLSPAIHGPVARHPRTAVGLSADGHTLYLLVVDGRSDESGGVTAAELSGLLRDLGAREGVKLDGGGSSTLFIAGAGVVNRPCDGAPRRVANHLGVILHDDVPRTAPSWCTRPAHATWLPRTRSPWEPVAWLLVLVAPALLRLLGGALARRALVQRAS